MNLIIFFLLLCQVAAGASAQEAAEEATTQEDRKLLLSGLISGLFSPLYPKTSPPTPRPTPRPTLRPVEPTTAVLAPPPSPQAVADHLKRMDAKIRATITANPNIAATYLRMGFHDCVPNGAAGGCDGCLNLATHDASKGLLVAVQALAPIVAEFESKALGVSRADTWAYATLVGAEVSQKEILFTDSFVVGRKNCETVGTCSSTDPYVCATNGPDVKTDFPDSDLTTHQLVSFMTDHFGFTADETVAIMGAHSIGRALPENSGYQGQEGWDNDHLKLGTIDVLLFVSGNLSL